MRPNQFATYFAALAILSAAPAVYAQDAHHNHGEHAEHAEHEEHEHHDHEAPHGGTLVVLGDEHAAHIELVLDSAKGQLTGYILDGEAEKAIRIDQPDIKINVAGGDLKSSAALTLKPVESPLTGEKAGNTSQFQATAPELKGAKKFEVSIDSLKVRGVEFKNTKSKFPEGNH